MIHKKPEISVVVPVYNNEATIRESIESALAQSFSNFELLVIDDGSCDSSINIISSIKDPRIKIFSFPNKGIAASLNRGINKANGDYIAFLDADDLWDSDKLRKQLDAIKRSDNYCLAYSWVVYIDERGQFLYPGNQMILNGNVYKELLFSNFLETESNPLINKQSIIEVGCFDEAINGAQDWDLFIRLASKYQFACVPEAQIHYRQSHKTKSSEMKNQERECLKALEKAYSNAPKALKHLKPVSLANQYIILSAKALSLINSRKGTITALYLYIKAMTLSKTAALNFKNHAKVILKILSFSLLPKSLLAKYPKRLNLIPLNEYTKKTC